MQGRSKELELVHAREIGAVVIVDKELGMIKYRITMIFATFWNLTNLRLIGWPNWAGSS